jgi:hypothetical protein
MQRKVPDRCHIQILGFQKNYEGKSRKQIFEKNTALKASIHTRQIDFKEKFIIRMTLSYGVMINVSKHQDDIIAKI